MSPLTVEQQALVGQHIELVQMQVKWQLQRLPANLRRCEHEDLVQEGMLGLMHAARRYEPQRCGPFAPYAVVYVRGALCRYLLRQMGGLAIPATWALEIVRQRRAAEAQASQPAGEMATAVPTETPRPRRSFAWLAAQMPRFLDLETSGSNLAAMACRRTRDKAREQTGTKANRGKTGWSVEQLHARYEQALQRAVGRIKTRSMAQIDHVALVQAVVQERLAVPEGQYRTPRRAMARRFGCSPTRVWNMEVRILRLVQRDLASEAGLSHEAATLICRISKLGNATRVAPPIGRVAGVRQELLLHGIVPGR